jgi:hypothetical protein
MTGVWQCTHPILAKVSRPFSLDGVGGTGAGGASIRLKLANASMSEMTAGFEMSLDVVEGGVVKLRLSLGVGGEETAGCFIALLRE